MRIPRKTNDLEEVAEGTDAESTALKNSFTLSKEDKEMKNKKKHEVGDDIELDNLPDEIENGKNYVEVDADLQKEKNQTKKKKKRKIEFSEEVTDCDAVIGVDNSIKLSKKDKTKKNKRKRDVGGDIVLDDTCDEGLHGKGSVEVDNSLQKEKDQKKKKRRNLESGEDEHALNDKTRMEGEEGVSLQTDVDWMDVGNGSELKSRKDDEKMHKNLRAEKASLQTDDDWTVVGNGNELKSRKDEKKMHKKLKEKDGNNTVSSSRYIVADENMGSTEVVKRHKRCEKEDITKIKNPEEGAKEKKKKNKGGRDIEDRDVKEKKAKDGKDIGKSREDCDGDVFEEVEKKKMKKEKKKDKDDLGAGLHKTFTDELGNETTTFGDKDFADNESNAHPSITEIQDSEAKNGNKGKRKKIKSVENETEIPKAKAKSKKVSFSGHVEVFPSSDKSTGKEKDQEDDLVRGKRFSREEDEIIKEAVLNYINVHGLGKEGLNMVLHCRSYPELKNCWKEIGAAIPYRPSSAIYYRAHILFERDENRTWTKEEYELIRKFQEKHGNNWKLLADELGKHRFHVKDTWRRIKLPNMKKGHWSQEEYQTLFDIVNKDLQMKASEEKKSKHGMLRDNICWSAISDQLSTRANATCCQKWYQQLTSSLVVEGKWADVDDYRLLDELFNLDACCVEDVDWDSLLEHRSGDVCRKRWDQMVLHIGQHGSKPFAEQVDILAKRYCPYLIEAREALDSKPVLP